MKRLLVFLSIFVLGSLSATAQRHLDNYRSPDKNGLNIFEDPKDTVSTFNGLNVRLGGAFAIQFQGLNHSNNGNSELLEIGNNFNLPTANLDLDVALYDGVRLHLRTYLSSRHHPEPYVKGGYMQIDKLDFIQKDFLKDLMNHISIRVGHMENNYGDAHFRRSDNAQALYNPLVGNLIMDGFTTEVGGEITYQNQGWIAMASITNGKLNQSVANPGKTGPSFIAKLGYDKQMDEIRLRLTGSVYHTSKTANAVLYGADRAGSRYYLVMESPGATPAGNFTSGRFNPMLRNEMTAFMINPFLKYGGLEFFGTWELATGKANNESSNRSFNQLAAELLYRFGNTDNFYLAGRYNQVSGEEIGTGNDLKINRVQFGGGWFMTKNILAKLEYVNQSYDGFGSGTNFADGKFNGLMLEAVISF